MNEEIATKLSWANRKLLLAQLSHRSQVEFALFCAKQNNNSNENVLKVIKATEQWLEGKVSSAECRSIAIEAASTDDSAYCAAFAASDSETAAFAAFYSATYAVHVAFAEDIKVLPFSTKKKQVDFLRDLINKEAA